MVYILNKINEFSAVTEADQTHCYDSVLLETERYVYIWGVSSLAQCL